MKKAHKMTVPELWHTAAQYIVQLCVFFSLVALLIFFVREVYDLFIAFPEARDRKILHDIAFLVVIVKAYRVLMSYLRNSQVNIKYIIEISIVAPAVEIVFAADKWPLWLNIVFIAYGGFNLLVYILLYENIQKIESDISGAV